MRAPLGPALSIASSRWQAVTPEPHISTTCRIALPITPAVRAQFLCIAQAAVGDVQRNGRLTAPGTWRPGPAALLAARKRSPARASTNQPGACFRRAVISSALATWVVSKARVGRQRCHFSLAAFQRVTGGRQAAMPPSTPWCARSGAAATTGASGTCCRRCHRRPPPAECRCPLPQFRGGIAVGQWMATMADAAEIGQITVEIGMHRSRYVSCQVLAARSLRVRQRSTRTHHTHGGTGGGTGVDHAYAFAQRGARVSTSTRVVHGCLIGFIALAPGGDAGCRGWPVPPEMLAGPAIPRTWRMRPR